MKRRSIVSKKDNRVLILEKREEDHIYSYSKDKLSKNSQTCEEECKWELTKGKFWKNPKRNFLFLKKKHSSSLISTIAKVHIYI